MRSYQEQNTEFTPRQQWISHNGKKQLVKNLRISCQSVLNSKDPATVKILKQVREYVAGKFEEYGLLMMIHQAMDTSESTGLSFPECMEYIYDKLTNVTNEGA